MNHQPDTAQPETMKNQFKLRRRRLLLSTIVAGLLGLGTAGFALSDSDHDDDDDHHGEYRRLGFKLADDVAPVTDPTYAEECSACHMAYQPGLLPAAAWQQVMTVEGLGNHYGDDASLPDDLRRELAAYLQANAADGARRSRSRAFAVGTAGSGELPRITLSRYFRNEHHEIADRLVTGNPEVGSFSNCNACHTGADEGVYNEHRVRIPGYGRWDD
jgi:hypothetical protein